MAVTSLAVVDRYDIGVPRQIPDWEQEVVHKIQQEFAQYQTWRANFGRLWEETAEILLPTSRNTFFYQSFNWPGQKKTQQQIDGTGGLALHRFCAIADSLVTPRNMKWHGLTAGGPNADYIMADRQTRLWFEDTTRALFTERYKANANFSAQNYNNWQSLGAFGNSTMFCDAFDGRYYGGELGLRYRAVPLGETFYGENHQGKVDRIIRWFRMTAYQAVQKWGLDRLPANLYAPLKQNSQWLYNFLHCVKPRENYDPRAVGIKGKKLVDMLPTGNIQISEKMMAEERSLIDDTFLVSLFKVLTDNPNMTATQVIELVNEKSMLVAPTLGRQHQEYIGGMVPRELDLLADMGMLQPMPPRLREARGEYEIVDTSPLALAARANEAAGFIRTVESVKELVNITQNMGLLDPFDFDVAVPEISRIQNVPERWMSDVEAIAQKRKARAQQAAQQAQIQALPAQAAMIKAQATVAKAQPGVAPGQAFGGPQQ